MDPAATNTVVSATGITPKKQVKERKLAKDARLSQRSA
jgi:hypothetical protein